MTDLECAFDVTDVVVMDTGSGFLKVGFSGEDAPRAVFPTCRAVLQNDEAKDDEVSHAGDGSGLKSQSFFGQEAIRAEGDGAQLTWPMERGVVPEDQQDTMVQVWEHALKSILQGELDDLPILLCDKPGTHIKDRMWMVEVMFENFKVRSLSIFNTGVSALFSTGKTRGLMVESGEGCTHSVPIFEGYAIPHATFPVAVAGQDITTALQSSMVERQCQYTMYHTMQAMKEKLCSVAHNYEQQISEPDKADEESKSFELPDGTIIQVPHNIRLSAPEILFQGDASLPIQCKLSLQTCDQWFREDLLPNIFIAGGSSMLPGLAPRLKTELLSLLPSDYGRQIAIHADSQRKYGAWIGGSMFASLSTFEQVVITRNDFDERGPDPGCRSLVARKTF
mmetsp:Transcript_27238/g.65600  ORF Transcript_27238/g.65600 Transcript_27238/m.65600 type:complete len:393 (+) Transcript_27238:51-1229(+)